MDRIRVLSMFLVIFIIARGSIGSPHPRLRVLMAKNLEKGSSNDTESSPGNLQTNIDESKDRSSNSPLIGHMPLGKAENGSIENPESNSTNSGQNLPKTVQSPPVSEKFDENSPLPSPGKDVKKEDERTKNESIGKTPQGPEGKSGGKNSEVGNKDKNHGGSEVVVNPNEPKPKEECSTSNSCTDQNKLIACLRRPGNGSQVLLLVVQNEGEEALTVNIVAPDSVNLGDKVLQLPMHKSKKIKVLINAGDYPKIVLNAGNGDCVLHTEPPLSAVNFFRQLPSYTTLMTPIYGAYFLFVTLLVTGVTWACCKFGRKRQHGGGGIQYQQLEMGLHASSTQGTAAGKADVDTTDGWDRDWDDVWEEDESARLPETHAGNVTINGVSSRASKREGWDDDWDD